MKKVISSEKRPIKLWLDDIEEGALAQAKNLANLPFIFKHIALMPDAHQGYGMPIGGVMATQGVVVPNAVGVDIGCGMCVVKTSLRVEPTTQEMLKRIVEEIKKVVPVGFNRHKHRQSNMIDLPDGCEISEREYLNAETSLGTLGGGNHFIEIQAGSDGNVWVMIHRKGATSAREGQLGIIPGSQGTSSYIVSGKGNKESFTSCSHGAGRRMGRKQAERELDLQSEIKRLDDRGVIHNIRTEKDLDEAAGAYKDIDVVMANQADLVNIEIELKPMAVIKG